MVGFHFYRQGNTTEIVVTGELSVGVVVRGGHLCGEGWTLLFGDGWTLLCGGISLLSAR